MKDERTVNDEYRILAEEVIRDNPELSYIAHSQARIVYLESSLEKKGRGKIIHGECEKIAQKYKWGIPADFTITLYEPNNRHMDEDQLKRLLFHELLHVEITHLDDGTESYSIRPHDLEDFKLIIDKFGTDWAKDAQLEL